VFHGTGEKYSIIQHGIVFVGIPAFFNILATIYRANKVREDQREACTFGAANLRRLRNGG
jgi:hypothetical protein